MALAGHVLTIGLVGIVALVAIAIVIDMLPTEGCPCYGCSQRRRASRRVK
jgi:hypothetical protein